MKSESPYSIERVTWLDSSIINEQTDNLPKPNTIVSVGWIAKETDDYIVVVRDHHPDPDSYDWRGSCAIPKFAIVERTKYTASVASPTKEQGGGK